METNVFIIGNGFDLAHNLPTSYCDFLLWYINKAIDIHNEAPNSCYNDGLISTIVKQEIQNIKSLRACLNFA